MSGVRVLACVVAAAAGVAIPVLAYGGTSSASSPGATMLAQDFKFVNAANTNEAAVTVAPGATVAFAYPTGTSAHNVDFIAGHPTSCTQDGSAGAVPPLPPHPSPAGWSGSCEFDTAGTYTFLCDMHNDMFGQVIVQDGGATTTTSTDTTASSTDTTTTPTTDTTTTTATTDTTTTATSDTTTPTTTTTTTTTKPPPASSTTTASTPSSTASSTQGPPIDSVPVKPVTATTTTTVPDMKAVLAPAASRLVVASTQRGTSVRGSIVIARSRSRLKVTVLAGRATVGTLSKTAGAGKASFSISVSLGRSSRRALHRAHRLTLTVKVLVTPATGPPYTATRQTVLKPVT
jgi:plastocyanin